MRPRRPREGRRRRAGRPRRILRALIVLAGVLIPQAILTGPALLGRAILLPLDILKLPGVYLPPRYLGVESRHQDMTYSDLVLQLEPNRQFAVREVRAGRLPLW